MELVRYLCVTDVPTPPHDSTEIQNACEQVCPHCHLTVLEHGVLVRRIAHYAL